MLNRRTFKKRVLPGGREQRNVGWYPPILFKGGAYFTELGSHTNTDSKYDLSGVAFTSPRTGKTYTLSGNFNDGCLQINNTTLSQSMLNPDSKKQETFMKDTWVSVITADSYPIQEAWRNWAGQASAEQYLENHGYKVMLAHPGYSEGTKSGELSVKWSQVTKTIVEMSWKAIYAENDGKFMSTVNGMKMMTKNYGYDLCVEWSKEEAAKKWACQQAALAMGE